MPAVPECQMNEHATGCLVPPTTLTQNQTTAPQTQKHGELREGRGESETGQWASCGLALWLW